MIKAACHGCGWQFLVLPRVADSEDKCPRCGESVQVAGAPAPQGTAGPPRVGFLGPDGRADMLLSLGQRLVVLGGFVLIVLLGVFPPWVYERHPVVEQWGGKVRELRGYGFFLDRGPLYFDLGVYHGPAFDLMVWAWVGVAVAVAVALGVLALSRHAVRRLRNVVRR